MLLVTSRNGKRWIVPKGIIEPHMSAAESAMKEAFEEAGIRGIVYPKAIGEYHYQKWGGVCWMTMFLMEVEEIFDEWPECGFRKRQWLDFNTVNNRLDERVPRSFLKQFYRLIDNRDVTDLERIAPFSPPIP